MQKLFNFLMVGLTFAVLNVATVAAQADLPVADTSAAPIGEGGEGGEAGGPAAQDMGGNMIKDGGHGANTADDEAEAQAAWEAAKKANAIAGCIENGFTCEEEWENLVRSPYHEDRK